MTVTGPVTPAVAMSQAVTDQAVTNPVPSLAAVSPTITLSWLNNNPGNTNVVTGIESTTDFVNWQTRCVTNCADVTNYATLPMTSPHEFFRAFTK